MTSGKISEQIVGALQEKTGEDEVMAEFLIEMLYEESEHPGIWRAAKRTYKANIKKCSHDWSGDSED